ncbi:MAG TPA: NifB/NifX family molybdenum-iron cluster-binding protein [Candidatus Hydrogenedentes bacterium]|nr:NifB/NifX family molybdenum-iron cluster-binding protein [Candidatus Hydrogenedentota bacterium]
MLESFKKEDEVMKIAIPLSEGRLSMHFGHCEQFAIVEVDPERKQVLSRQDEPSPPHQPGLLPEWLAARGVDVVIAGGMGTRAQSLFAAHGIEVRVGAPSETPEKLAAAYIAGTLQQGDNFCAH